MVTLTTTLTQGKIHMSGYKKAVVFGGNGMIGAKVVTRLKEAGLEVIAASRRTHVDITTGRGLVEILQGADVVVDASDVPSFDPETLKTFFRAAGEHIYAAELAAGVKHHVTLSIVGVDDVRGNPYFDAKLGQEEMARASGVPFTLARATQFFEFLPTIAAGFTKGATTGLPDALFRPIAADDVATALAAIALAPPVNAAVSIAGLEAASFERWFKRFFDLVQDPRQAETDPAATYFGARLQPCSIVPAAPDYIGAMCLEHWVTSPSARMALSDDRHAHATAQISKQIQ